MRTIARFFLWLTTAAIPVFLAACYGMPYGYSKSGKVVDSETKEGIDDIEVTCIVNGSQHSFTTTYNGGTFNISYDTPCDSLFVEDVDGEANGGVYQPRSVPFDEGTADLTIELSH